MNIIAEIGTSHNGSFEHAKSLIDAAKDAGADTVKFQWVYAEEILHPDTGFVELPGGRIPLYERFKSLEVPEKFYSDCIDYCEKKSIKFACSPFGPKSLDQLFSLNPDYIKIASPELNHIPLLKKCAQNKKNIPIILSSGVSKLSDIEKALEILSEKDVTLLHCSTFYPTPEEEYNVSLIENLSRIFGIKTGISDHSLDPVLVPVLSCAFGAVCIEKHITLSNQTDGLDDPVALTPENFAMMVYEVHQAQAVINRVNKSILAENTEKNDLESMPVNQKAREIIVDQMKAQFGEEKVNKTIGDGIKRLSKSESLNYGRTNRSIHFTRDLKKGSVITENDIAVLRTEKILTPGLNPEFLETVKGAVLTKNVSSGEGLLWEHLLTDSACNLSDNP